MIIRRSEESSHYLLYQKIGHESASTTCLRMRLDIPETTYKVPLTWACKEVIVHRRNKAIMVFVRRDDCDFTPRVQILFRLVLECLREGVAANSIYKSAGNLPALFVDAQQETAKH